MPSEPSIEAALKRLKHAALQLEAHFVYLDNRDVTKTSASVAYNDIHATIADLTPKRYYVNESTNRTVRDHQKAKNWFTCGSNDAAVWLADFLNAHEEDT